MIKTDVLSREEHEELLKVLNNARDKINARFQDLENGKAQLSPLENKDKLLELVDSIGHTLKNL